MWKKLKALYNKIKIKLFLFFLNRNQKEALDNAMKRVYDFRKDGVILSSKEIALFEEIAKPYMEIAIKNKLPDFDIITVVSKLKLDPNINSDDGIITILSILAKKDTLNSLDEINEWDIAYNSLIIQSTLYYDFEETIDRGLNELIQ